MVARPEATMTITLSDTTTAIELDPDLKWSDEHSWSPVTQTARYKLNGALSVHVSKRRAGRPITLQGDDSYGWPGMTGEKVAQLEAWAAIEGQVLTLSMRGESWSVMFRHQEAPAFEARPILDYSDPEPSDCYVITLKLMVI